MSSSSLGPGASSPFGRRRLQTRFRRARVRRLRPVSLVQVLRADLIRVRRWRKSQ